MSSKTLSDVADRSLELYDLQGISRLLTRTLPEILGLPWATLQLWDRKLDSFQSLSSHQTQERPERSEQEDAPAARFMISEGQLLETRGEGNEGEGVLLPLMARSGLVGMLLLAEPPAPEGARSLEPEQVENLWQIASRAALAVENHLYQQELIASERMAALGTMASMLAHDFRGPMTVIRGYAERLASEDVSLDEIRERAQVIVTTIDRLDRMTSETLDFARGGERLVTRPVALRAWLEMLGQELGEEYPGLAVQRDLEMPGDLRASLDVDKLRRAIENIAANALDAMKGEGRLRLGARLEPGTAEGEPEAPLLLLELSDDGPGIPEEIREQIFEPFVTQGKTRGTGLGLAVARRFVEDHGGRLELLPRSPGAHFRITLPLGAGATLDTRS